MNDEKTEWERYGEYFMNRSVSDIMEEYSEQHDEWHNINSYMNIAIEEARTGIKAGHGGPFGCVIVKDGKIAGKGHNEVLKLKDPTCHGEIMAIRDACKTLGSIDLSGCKLYTTAQPCPMCLGAIQWANIRTVFYGCNISDTDKIGFRDKQFYSSNDICCEEMNREECLALFEEYSALKDKQSY